MILLFIVSIFGLFYCFHRMAVLDKETQKPKSVEEAYWKWRYTKGRFEELKPEQIVKLIKYNFIEKR